MGWEPTFAKRGRQYSAECGHSKHTGPAPPPLDRLIDIVRYRSWCRMKVFKLSIIVRIQVAKFDRQRAERDYGASLIWKELKLEGV